MTALWDAKRAQLNNNNERERRETKAHPFDNGFLATWETQRATFQAVRMPANPENPVSFSAGRR
jgi:hypothetical protein